MGNVAEENRKLGLRINAEIWNNQRFELIPECFTEDFVADYSPRIVRKGRDQVEQMVKAAHSAFKGFRETVHDIVTDEASIVIHFTISGTQIGEWGPISATHRPVKYDEIVIMKVRNGKVYRQIGVSDSLLAFQQLGLVPDPGGFVQNSFR